MNTNYIRVIPRDLFNESKLLKCIGKLTLLIHDNLAPTGLTFEHENEPFNIGLMDEGSLSINNIRFSFNETPLLFKTTYNSKNNYPLQCEFELCDYLVFNEDGELSEEFTDFLEELI